MKGPESEFNSSYIVRRCHSIDELVNPSNTNNNIDDKLVNIEEGSSVFSHVQTRLICRGSFLPTVLTQFT